MDLEINKINEDIEMIEEDNLSTEKDKNSSEENNNKPNNYLLSGSLLPQRTYLSNRTGQYLSRKQKIDHLKRKDLDQQESLDNELNFNIKKLRVD